MSRDLSSAAKCYGLYDEEKIVGFCAVLHQPHGVNKKIKRVSRIVILPDYQGIGLGYKFLCVIAKHYSSLGFDFSIVTSAKNFIKKLDKSNEWQLRRIGANKCSSTKSAIDYKRESMRSKCKTASFFYTKNSLHKILLSRFCTPLRFSFADLT